MQIKCQNCLKITDKRRGTKFCSLECYWEDKEGSSASQYHKDAMSAGLIGRKLSAEHKQKLSRRGPAHWRWNDDRADQQNRNRLAKAYRTLIGRTLGWKKQNKTNVELGYSSSDLRIHLEKLFVDGMSWNNHGKGHGKWHIDHVQPISSFELGTPPDIVNALSNLQPLWEEDNLSKGGVGNGNKYGKTK